MGKITLLNYQSDGDGGWLVHWRDDANLDGGPLEAFTHVKESLMDELEAQRRLTVAPETKMKDAAMTLRADALTMATAKANAQGAEQIDQRVVLGIPPGIVPHAVQDFLDGYEQHLNDVIDRAQYRLNGKVPYSKLQELRDSGAPKPGFVDDAEPGPMEAFINATSE